MNNFISSARRLARRQTAIAIGAAFSAAVAGTLASAAPNIPSNFVPVQVNGSPTAFTTPAGQGAAFNVIYDAGVYHLWYRADASTYSVGELRHATSTDGINFTTVGGAFTFANTPFPTGTPPLLYYDAVSKVGANFKIQHWTSNGDAGTYPPYDYNSSISSIGTNPANTAVTHQGAIVGGTLGQTAGSFGIVGGNWYGQCGNTGQEICRAAYTDTSPPSVPASIYPSALNASTLFTGLGIPTGYINNHGDIAAGISGLDVAFTVRTDSSGARFNKQVYYANSLDNGATWGAITPLIAGTPLLNGSPFGSGNFAHPELVLGANNLYKLYVSAVDAQGNFVIAVAGNTLVVLPEGRPVPTTGTGTLAALAATLLGAAFWMRRRLAAKRH